MPELVHVPGLAVNRAAHGYAGGERKSDPQDARVIADLVRTRRGLRPIRPRRIRSPAALAAAAGLAPVLRQSGHSRSLRRARRGDRDLKRVLYQSAFCAFSSHPHSRAHNDRKRREGKHRVQAVIALARQRTNVPWAMLTHDKPYDPNHRAA